MITKLSLKNFKRFNDHTFEFKPRGITLLAGGNNSGKSSILQAMSVWEFCRSIIERRKGRQALEDGKLPKSGVGLNTDEFSPVALPDLRHLWTNLTTSDGKAGDGYSLHIGLTWHDGTGAAWELEFSMALSNDRIFVKPTKSTVTAGMAIPQMAYLPSFAGIQPREERLSPAMQRRLIGRGMAGAALRNILYDLFQAHGKKKESLRRSNGELDRAAWSKSLATDPWWHLLETLQECFEASLKVEPFDEFHQTLLEVFFFRGKYIKTTFKKHSGYKERDVMSEGSGFLQWLSVYALVVNPSVNVLLLDEPDAHLHPTLQAELFFRLRQRALQNSKQVLIATHSTELLRTVDPDQIFELSTKRRGYLSSNVQRVALFAGIGSEYAPRLDVLKRKKRLVFVEGDFEEGILPTLMSKTTTPWNTDWVFWKTTLGHSDRSQLFKQLQAEIDGLKGISIRDRNDKVSIGDVGADCIENNYRHHRNHGLLCITWRRRELENYLLVIRAIAEASGRSEDEIRAF